MFNLILTIVAIGIFVLAATAGSGYITFDSIQAYVNKSSASSMITSLSFSIIEYVEINNENPNGFYDLIDGRFIPKIPLFAKTLQSWSPSLSDSSLSDFHVDEKGGVYFCFGSSEMQQYDYEAMTSLKAEYYGSSMTISSSCYDFNEIPQPESFPENVWITYKVK